MNVSFRAFSTYEIVLSSCFLSPVIAERDDPGVSNDQLPIRLTIQLQGDRKSQGSNCDRMVCACVHIIMCVCESILRVGVMNFEPCVQLTSTLSTDCLVTEHMISVLTQRCVMKAGGAHSRGETVWLTAALHILLPIFLFH